MATRFYDDNGRVAEITMIGVNGIEWQDDFFAVGGLAWDDELKAYKVDDVHYLRDQADDWKNGTGDFADTGVGEDEYYTYKELDMSPSWWLDEWRGEGGHYSDLLNADSKAEAMETARHYYEHRLTASERKRVTSLCVVYAPTNPATGGAYLSGMTETATLI